jgi:hypothetical protein
MRIGLVVSAVYFRLNISRGEQAYAAANRQLAKFSLANAV